MGSDEMGSYYRDPDLAFHIDDRFNHNHIPLSNPNGRHVGDQGDNERSQEAGPTRYCSVRGCTSVLPPNYGNKMCEVCRGRHRVYASTKRAKRKMEKAALGLQNGWIPTEDDPHPSEPSSSSTANLIPIQEDTSSEPTHPQYAYPNGSWENSTLDPRLFQPSTSSELAGALILPASSSSQPRSPAHASIPVLHPSSSMIPEGSISPSTSTPIFPSYQPNEQAQARQSTPQKEISVQSISEAAAVQPSGSLPPRFCSIKGCKTVMDGNSLFKMCDVCRGKYKTYGTTKRKKWKEEKAKALAELEKEREERNRIRAEQGLPPLPSIGTVTWPEETVAGRAINTSVPRMCTVSHCREILPVGYAFLRCERHRIQNRHHSKLKRVRDKDAKAQALEGFFATITGPSGFQQVDMSSPDGMFVEGSSDGDNHVPLTEIYSMDEQKRTEEVDLNVVEPQVIVFGVPPAARGVRRSNHVCSIKGCHNLLSPTTPWKMCDDCRAHERSVRKIRALRESGVMVEPLPPRLPPRERKEKSSKEKKVKGSRKERIEGNGERLSQSHDSSPDTTDDANDTSIIFMDPVLLGENDEASEPQPSHPPQISFIMADDEGNIPETRDCAQQRDSPTDNSDLTVSVSLSSPATSTTGKKKSPRKKDAVATESMLPPIHATAPAIAESSQPPPSTSSAPTHCPYPPYVSPYYPSPPGYAVQYPPGGPYPYSPIPLPPAFPRDGFAPSPMYQPPYPAYPGYPPPYPPPYGYYPPPFGLYPPPPPPTTTQAPTQAVSAPPLPQPQASSSTNETDTTSTSTNPNAPTGTNLHPSSYSSGVVSYVTAASGGGVTSTPTPPSSGLYPLPPPDRSSMYSMFSVRLNDTSKSPDGPPTATAVAATSASTINGSTPSMQVVTANSEKQKEGGMIWVDRMPEKRKRRKADLAAVEAYLKKREQERVRSEGGAVEDPTTCGVVSTPANERLVPQGTHIEVHEPVTSEVDVRVGAVVEAPKLRLCINKMCERALSAAETGTICGRCKEKMKKRAMKVKKRFKLVMPSSKPLTKQSSNPVDGVGDDGDNGDDGMEVLVEETLAPSVSQSGRIM